MKIFAGKGRKTKPQERKRETSSKAVKQWRKMKSRGDKGREPNWSKVWKHTEGRRLGQERHPPSHNFFLFFFFAPKFASDDFFFYFPLGIFSFFFFFFFFFFVHRRKEKEKERNGGGYSMCVLRLLPYRLACSACVLFCFSYGFKNGGHLHIRWEKKTRKQFFLRTVEQKQKRFFWAVGRTNYHNFFPNFFYKISHKNHVGTYARFPVFLSFISGTSPHTNITFLALFESLPAAFRRSPSHTNHKI